ncbi:unnamed protein product [Bursaphelenchus okinawaensis]|uniref:Maestro heat-like repeat-containing protein family member 1 n=1 Tax=Bursaphelenchus okinawaensis TaxID=465554 RepID=A0A811JSD2_9BILA|nr:unnamed protein product [Bursaphelenchus okinawaensis]CAG9080752.1 unnamed protein product [Bursaphelenchus okinawaensis]
MATNLEDLVLALFDSVLKTTNDETKEALAESLFNFGLKRPALFLTAAHAYLVQHNKLSDNHREFVLKSISKVIQRQSAAEQLDEQQVLLVINLATQEMTMSKDSDDEWAKAARDVLVTLAKYDRFVGHVMDAVLLKFPPGLHVSPHKYITLTLAYVAQHNPFGFVPFLTDVLSRTVPLLSYLKQEQLKNAWARALTAFCESLIEFSSSNESENPEAVENVEYIPRQIVTQDLQQNYSDQLEAAYDIVIHWVNSKDSKCRADSTECVGILSLFVTRERLSKDLKKIVTSFLNIYKKATSPKEQYHITKGIGYFLESCCLDAVVPLEYYLDDVFNSLFPNVCVVTEQCFTADESQDHVLNSDAIKVRNEAFRCFHVASSRFADKQVYYLIHKIQSEKDSIKLGATNFMRHLLNSAGSQMEDKRSLITMGIKPLLVDSQLAVMVKMGVCQLCVALADHGYVDADNGGVHVVQFLVKNLIINEETGATAIPSSQNIKTIRLSPEQNALLQLQQQCAQALQTIAKTCESSETLLWPYLFEFVCNETYSPALGDIFKCIRILVNKKKQKEQSLDFAKDIETNAKLAGPVQTFARLLVCLNRAIVNGQIQKRSKEATRLLIDLAEWIHPHLATELPEKATDILKAFEEMSTSFDTSSPTKTFAHSIELHDLANVTQSRQKRFQQLSLDLLSASIQKVRDGDWRQTLAAALGQQLRLYVNYPQDRAFAMQLLGSVLSRVANTAFVIEHINLMVRSANLANSVERQGCAMGLGLCAQVHTDLVLTELENIAKWEHSRKGAGIFSFLKDAMPYGKGSDVDIVNLRATVILSYGYVTLNCPDDLLVQRLESTTLPFLRQYLAGFKPEIPIKEAHLETIHLIGLAVHPSNLNAEYQFESRYECFTYMKTYVKSESKDSLSNCVLLHAAKATATLCSLEPAISDNELWDLGNVLTQAIFPICREKSGLKCTNDEDTATMMDSTVQQYQTAIACIVAKRPVVHTVSQLLKIFHPYFSSLADHERSRSIETTVLILQIYSSDPKDCTLGHANNFGPLCSILGRLAPRLADSVASVRLAAVRTVYLGFRLSLLHSGHSPLETDVLDDALFDLDAFINKHLHDDGKQDTNKVRETISAIGDEIEARLPQNQLQTYLSVLFKMLSDRQSNVSTAAAQLLGIMVSNRGQLLSTEGEVLVKTITEQLELVQSSVHTYSDLLEAFRIFSHHQPHVTVEVLLKQPLPYSPSCVDMWKMLAHDQAHLMTILDYILEFSGFPYYEDSEVVNGTPPELVQVVDTGAGASVKVVTSRCCALLAALNEIVQHGEFDEQMLNKIPFCLAVLFNSLAAIIVDVVYPASSMKDPSLKPTTVITPELRRVTTIPANLVVHGLKSMLIKLNAIKSMDIMNAERGWSNLANTLQYPSAVAILCRALASEKPASMARLIGIMAIRVDKDRKECEKEAAALVLSSLVSRSPDQYGVFDFEVLRQITTALATAFDDSSLVVRRFALRGFTYVGLLHDMAQKSPETQTQFKTLAKDSFGFALAGLDAADDRNDLIGTEAMNTLLSICDVVDKELLDNALSSLLLKLRPCFEKECVDLRSVSFKLFAKLGQRMGSSDLFRESLHSNLVSIVLHLNDESLIVSQCCAYALTSLADIFTAPQTVTLIQSSIHDSEPPANYISFLEDFSTILAVCFPDRVNYYAMCCTNYFKSHFPKIQCNAARMVGFLLVSLSDELKETISKDIVFGAYSELLKEPNLKVREAAAEGILSLATFS